MKTPDQHHIKIKGLESIMGALEGDYSSVSKAQKTLNWLSTLRKQFGQIEEDIASDISFIRQHYSESRVEVSGLFGRSSRLEAQQRARITQERNSALMPYVSLKMQVARRVDQIEAALLDLQSFITTEHERGLTSQIVQDAATGRVDSDRHAPTFEGFCTNCGASVHEGDSFCRACGSNLQGEA